MKYNRQQKYNCCSAAKTVTLVMLMCLAVLLCYSYLKIRQKNISIQNSIETQKTQISDLEALSRANKEQLKNLRTKIETQKINLRKLLENISSYGKNVESERSFRDTKKTLNELEKKYEHLSQRINEVKKNETSKIQQEKETRATRIEGLRMELSKLKDVIANLKNPQAVDSSDKNKDVPPVVKKQVDQEEKLKPNRGKGGMKQSGGDKDRSL